jgi:hypothetical protein
MACQQVRFSRIVGARNDHVILELNVIRTIVSDWHGSVFSPFLCSLALMLACIAIAVEALSP